MLPQPDWSQTPEHQLLNHRLMSRTLLPEFVDCVALAWETPRNPQSMTMEEIMETDPDDFKPVKSRDDFIELIQQALNDNCLEEMIEPTTDADMVCAIHVLGLATCTSPIALPAETHATLTQVHKAGFDSLEHLVGTINQELRTMSKEAALV